MTERTGPQSLATPVRSTVKSNPSRSLVGLAYRWRLHWHGKVKNNRRKGGSYCYPHLYEKCRSCDGSFRPVRWNRASNRIVVFAKQLPTFLVLETDSLWSFPEWQLWLSVSWGGNTGHPAQSERPCGGSMLYFWRLCMLWLQAQRCWAKQIAPYFQVSWLFLQTRFKCYDSCNPFTVSLEERVCREAP